MAGRDEEQTSAGSPVAALAEAPSALDPVARALVRARVSSRLFDAVPDPVAIGRFHVLERIA